MNTIEIKTSAPRPWHPRSSPATKCLAALLTLVCLASPAFAQTPATQPAAAKEPTEVGVRELLILVAEPGQSHANHESAFKQTLPLAPGSRRAMAGEDDRLKPMGGGLITIAGPGNARLEVSVGIPTSRFIAAYPTPDNQVGTIAWRAVSVSPGGKPTIGAPAGHWINALRDANARPLATQRKQVEACLFYDAAVEYAFPLKIESDKNGYTLTSLSKAPLRDMQLIKPDSSGRARLWTVKELAPSATISPAVETAPGADARDTVFKWRREPLIAKGYSPAEADHAVAALKALAWQDRFLTIVYTLDGDELNRMLPLTVTPKPASVIRTAIVIVRNADPAVGGEIDSLIAQLGASEWQKRAEATKSLAALGGLARPKLQEATKNKDVEIALRAERLLEAIDPQRTPNNPAGRAIRSSTLTPAGGDGAGDSNQTAELIAE